MKSHFRLNRLSAAVMAATASLAFVQNSFAGPGFGDAYDLNQTPFIIQSYFASSPSGDRLWTTTDGVTPAPLTGAPSAYAPINQTEYSRVVNQLFPTGYKGTGKALRKFVDPLPLPSGHALALKAPNAPRLADGVTDKYIPVAVASKWVKPDGSASADDYYEIAAVEYSEKFHSDLRKPSTLRGYVQIDHLASNGRGALLGSKALALYYPNSSGKVTFAAGAAIPADAVAIQIAGTDATGKLTGTKVNAIVVDAPHYLGPVIQATSTNPISTATLAGAPTRIKFLNLLPTGRAETTTTSIPEYDPISKAFVAKAAATVAVDALTNLPKRHGDMFLPLDPSVPGAGFGPDGMHTYSQNRSNIHLHGGDSPWISDGGPHTWITPADEADPSVAGSIASLNPEPLVGPLDPTLVPGFLRGSGALNVPDMVDPGPGAMTYYFPNGQSARMEWYHDHTVGITRLNVYAGLASAYLLTDATEQGLITAGKLPGADATIPLVLQEKTFVPDDIALQDARWDTSAWGAPADLWYAHVYETVQDPNQWTNFNSVGRWHWGPWFWPSYPSAYNLPSGAYGDVTLTPENWMDTPLVNGTAYPTLTVEPKPYRFKILNASNDRTFTFNMFVADSSVVTDDGRTDTEVKMVPVNSWTATLCADPNATRSDGTCTPASWSTDVYGHAGGVPDATTQGPTIYQVGNEGGLLPGVAIKEPTPVTYLLDKGRAAVLNVDFGATGLHIGNAERADIVVDFSKYAGKTLIIYNDSGAPIPAADPRNEYFTGYGDNSATGGAEDTRPGYGPNTRTIMQIKVSAAGTVTGVAAADPATIDADIKAAYKIAQETPVVAQSAYNGALGTTWNDTKAFATVFTGSLKSPSFNFVPGTPSPAFNSILVQSQGSGYTRTPTVTLTGGGGVGAAAKASLKIAEMHPINPGSGYKVAPTVTITSNGSGSGATANATINVSNVTITKGGTGYTSAPTVKFSAAPLGGVTATGTATVTGGAVTGVTINNAGKGYAVAPTVSFTGGGGTGAVASAAGSVEAFQLIYQDPTNPGTAGGGGYGDLSTAASEPANPTPGMTITMTAPPAGGVTATAGATGRVFDVTLSNFGSGYTSAPTVAILPSPLEPVSSVIVAATAAADTTINPTVPQGNFLVKTKAIQELFDPTYGRLNATFGVEIPYTSALTQTTIPLGYVDAPTEEIADGETQIWKITHNGVDTHPIHFHLVNVQLINRVGWDNFISPPEPNELGWKETIKMSPLEDVIVAVRAKKPKLPGFGLPNSYRLLDPSQPEGAMTGFTQIDPNTGVPATMANTWQDFGWEYVWHCHILGHEENDFMRPITFHANEAVPTAPTLNAASSSAAPAGVAVAWTDTSSTEYRFDVLRADVLPDNVTYGPFVAVGSALANSGTFFDTTAVGATNASGGTSLVYKVAAVGANGTAESGIVAAPLTVGPPPAPSALAALAQSGSQVQLAWTDNALNELGFTLVRNVGGVSTTTTLAQNSVVFTDTGLPADTLVSYQLSAFNAAGSSAVITAQAYTYGAPALTSLSATPNSPTQVTLAWTAAAAVRAQAVTGYTIVRTGGAGTVTFTAAAGATSFVDTTATQNTAYTYAVNTVNANGLTPVNGAVSTTSATTPYGLAGTLTTLGAVANSNTQVTLNWTGGVPATSYLVERCTATAANFNCTAASSVWLPAVTVNAPASGYVDSSVVANTTYAYRVTATNGPVNVSNTVTTTILTPGAVAVNAPTGLTATVNFALGRIALTWTDAATNETAFVVQRSTDGVNFSQVGTAAPRTGSIGLTRTFNDTAISQGITYYYRVIAQNVTGAVVSNSAPSNVVQIDYFLIAPSGLNAAVASPTRITLNWVDTTSAEASFAVWRSDNGAAAVQIGTVTRTAAQATATGGAVTFNNNNGAATPLVLGHTYSYYVTAVNGTVISPASTTVSVPFAAPAAPAALGAVVTITTATRANVALSWATAPTGVTYTVQRIAPAALGGGTTTLLANTTLTTLNDLNVRRNAAAYTYQIRANGIAGNSVYVTTSVVVN